MNPDEIYIRETIKLARKGIGWTNPNPMVGAMLVKNGQVIGKGYHKRVELPHAEIESLRDSKINPQGATLYINLEPCSHFGRTPPCVDAIIKAKIARVVCSSLDPNPKVSGKGIDKLRKVGINVSIGMLENEAIALNKAFFIFHQKKRPFIVLKFAASLDGKIATRNGNSKWITNEKTRNYARNLRSQYQAVLVGINTILSDNPHLGVRMKGKKDPLRIILDSTLKIPLHSKVLHDTNVLIATTTKANKEKKKILTRQGISILVFDGRNIPLHKLLAKLKEKEIISILVEGGGTMLGSFLDARLVDKVYAFQAPILIGGEKAKSAIGGQGVQTISQALHLKDLSYRKFKDNILTIGHAV